MTQSVTVTNQWDKRKCDAVVVIPTIVNNGILYLLNKFKHREWSGPAWFSFTKDESGFPETIKLEHFIPLHLGTGSFTEWDDDKLTPHLERMLADPKMAKNMTKWIRGNIHSHNTMSAFVSGTDEATIIENAPLTLKDFYFSLIVSSTSQYDFGFSYSDQFGYAHWYRADSVVIGDNDNVEELIFSQAAVIEEEAKPKYSSSKYTPKNYNVTKKEEKKETKQIEVGFGASIKKALTPGGNNTRQSQPSVIQQQLDDDDISHQSNVFTFNEAGEDAVLIGDEIFTVSALQIFLAYKHNYMQMKEANQELAFENTTIEEMEAHERAILAQS